MQTSRLSASEATAFDRLARPVQRWVRRQGWPALREVQELAIPVVIAGGDVIISAATASGKTEAAFLPLISRIVSAPAKPGYRGLYISPLKALINDQYRRLEGLCEDVALPLHMRHGDVAQSAKQRAAGADGLLLITPESLESMLMRRGGEISRLFSGVEAVVIDELHSFIGTERGLQLLSLLSRIEDSTGRAIDRIGLSATLGDMQLAASALRPGAETAVTLVEPQSSASKTVDLDILAFEAKADTGAVDDDEDDTSVSRRMTEELFDTFHGRPGLIFANSRNIVEEVAYKLREKCETERLPNAFLPHHGKLSKGLREFAEKEIRNTSAPTTLVATSTLEMGVDIGSVDCVAQIGAPRSVAALRQRVGRSGRRDGQRPRLRLFVSEQEPIAEGSAARHLHLGLVQGIAVTNLLQRGWCEPPLGNGLHFSTLVHQVIALITQHGGRSAAGLYVDLCHKGPFRSVSPRQLMGVLRNMASPELALIEQASDGMLLLGAKGEKRIEHFTFYAVFPTPEEYRVIADGKVLGTVFPDLSGFKIGDAISIAGRRWDIVEIKLEAKALVVVPSRRARLFWSRDLIHIHEEIGRQMKAILMGAGRIDGLNDDGQLLLDNARFAFKAALLEHSPIHDTGKDFELYPWTGTRQLEALALALQKLGVEARVGWPRAIVSNTSFSVLRRSLEQIAAQPPPLAEEMVGVLDKLPFRQKFDFAVPEDLRKLAFLHEDVDLQSIPRIAAQLLGPTAA